MFDFGNPATLDDGSPIGDGVMGGLSRSRLRRDAAGYAVLEGTVSLARGGGFASMRSSAGERGLAGARKCVVEARGDGRRCKLNLLTGGAFDGILDQAALAPDGHGWPGCGWRCRRSG
jgi:NADH dehydrogenase [ubiquinone] 1 alpha subcomplex assembly factor 1